MKFLLMIFLLFLGAVIQAVASIFSAAGLMPVPLLFCLSLYYTFTSDFDFALLVAFLAGVFQDAFSVMPLGYSSLSFCIVSAIVYFLKKHRFENNYKTYIIFGALGNALSVTIAYLLLKQMELINIYLWLFLLKLSAAFILGAIFTPLIFKIIDLLANKLGMIYDAKR